MSLSTGQSLALCYHRPGVHHLHCERRTYTTEQCQTSTTLSEGGGGALMSKLFVRVLQKMCCYNNKELTLEVCTRSEIVQLST